MKSNLDLGLIHLKKWLLCVIWRNTCANWWHKSSFGFKICCPMGQL